MDYLLIEGLYRKMSRRRGVVRVLCARSGREAAVLLKLHPKPVCILYRGTDRGHSFQGTPVLRLPRDLTLLTKLIAGKPGGQRRTRELLKEIVSQGPPLAEKRQRKW